MSEFYHVALVYSPHAPDPECCSEEDAQSPRMLKDGKWGPVMSDDEGRWPDLPSVWISNRTAIWIGTRELSGRRGTLDAYLGDGAYAHDCDEFMDAILEKMLPDGKRFDHETHLGCLIRLEWMPSVDWETGIDEGNVELGEVITEF